MSLTSSQNPLLKSIRRAAASGNPTDDGLVVAEGPNLLREALRGTWRIEQIFCTEAAGRKHADLLRASRSSRPDLSAVEMSARAMTSTASTESAQEIITLLRPHRWRWADLLHHDSLLIVFDGLQDPGNAGTIVRSAEAFGATGVIFLQGSTRSSNGKFLRASAGSIFRLPFLESITPATFLQQAAAAKIQVFSLDMRRSISIAQADLTQSCALIVGSEGSGVRAELLESSVALSIPTRKVESLNAAVASSLALFTAFSQRNQK